MVGSYSRVIILWSCTLKLSWHKSFSSHGTNLLTLLASHLLSNPVAFLMCESIRVHMSKSRVLTSFVLTCSMLFHFMSDVL
jgi:hypothetical protein